MIQLSKACFLHPIDTSINKSIKQFIRQKDTTLILNTGNIRPPYEEDIIEMFVKIWRNKKRENM